MQPLTHPREPLRAGFSHFHQAFREELAAHPEIELHVVQSGTAVCQLGGQGDVRLRAGDVLLLPGGTPHALAGSPPFHVGVIQFHPRLLDALPDLPAPLRKAARALRAPTTPPPCCRSSAPPLHERLVWLIEDAILERNRRDPGHEAVLQLLAAEAAIHALRLLAAGPSQPEADEAARRVRATQLWIDRRFMEPCSIAWLAGLAGLAPTYYAARFRALVGVPPMAYVRALRLRQAQDLLARTAEPVKAVAWSVGYRDLSRFHHAFRAATGLTPRQYRQQRQPRGAGRISRHAPLGRGP